MASDDYAIVAGINRYPSLTNDLEGAENDAKAFDEWLHSPNGGAVPSEMHEANGHCVLILSSQFEAPADPVMAEPTAIQLERAFDRLYDLGISRNGRVGRRLYLFLAGHGYGPEIREAALLMANAASGRAHHLPGRRYADWFCISAYFDEVVLFMDCCREDWPLVPIKPCHFDPELAERPTHWYYGFATGPSDTAREGHYGPSGDMYGLFTAALLHGLRGGARNQDGSVTGTSLKRFVRARMKKLSESDEPQLPHFDKNTEEDDDIVFATATPPYLLHVRLHPPYVGRSVEMYWGEFEVLGEKVAPDLWEWQLWMGLYVVRVSDGPERIIELPGQEGINYVDI